MIESGAPREVFEKLADPSALVEGYRALAAPPAPKRASRERRAAVVSIVIPYFRLDRYLRETLASAAAQVHPATEIVIVNDGSLREEDRIVYELAEEYGARVITQVNSGLGAARNFGIAQSRGSYVLPLDADDMIAPEFVARCVTRSSAIPIVGLRDDLGRVHGPERPPGIGRERWLLPVRELERADRAQQRRRDLCRP